MSTAAHPRTHSRHHPSPARAVVVSLALSALCVALAGCGRMFVVEVHNDSARRIIATMHPDKLRGEDTPLDQRTIAPGTAAVLGPHKAPALEFVALTITPAGGIAERGSTERLSQGRSSAFVEDAGPTDFGVIRVRVTKQD